MEKCFVHPRRIDPAVLSLPIFICLGLLLNTGHLFSVESDMDCELLDHITVLGPVNDPHVPDEYGGSIAASGSTLIVGAIVDGYPRSLRGAVFVYGRSNGLWFLEQKLTVLDEPPVQFLGSAVAIDGDTIVAGIPEAAVNGLVGGAAYLFERHGTAWVQRQKLQANDASTGQYFGYSVAIYGNVIIIGAPGDSNVTGAVYIFTREQSNWVQQAKLTASDGRVRDGFGWSVSVSEQALAVGSGVPGAEAGIGYLFEPTTLGWMQKARTEPQISGNSAQEIVVSVSGEWAAVNYKGLPRAVHLLQRREGTWVRRQTLRARDPGLETGFGFALALRGNKLAVGSPGSTISGHFSGLVHLFDFDGNLWVERQSVKPFEGVRERYFGRAVAVGGTGLFVGAVGQSFTTNASGVAYAFESDAEPPVVESVVSEPNYLWPPDNKLKPVEITVVANDDCSETHCRITSIAIKEESPHKGGLGNGVDWEITGDLTVNLRATPSRHGQNRIYAITLECQDDTGNTASSVVYVPVLHDRRLE